MTISRPLALLALLALQGSVAAAPATADSAALGRLFYTPQQRAALDRQRLLGPGQTGTLERQGSYTVNGEVRRSSGPRTRWINGEAETGQADEPSVPIGDTYHPATGEREDLLHGGRIIIRRGGRPAPR